MTQEEKAKAYDEAIERAKEYISAFEYQSNPLTEAAMEAAKDIFPGLVDSEDERIRKYLIEYIKNAGRSSDLFDTVNTKSAILAWLEKQKEQKEELVYRLNGLMQDYIKEGKSVEEKEHRFKCYQLFWDALEDADFFEQKEQKPVQDKEEKEYVRTLKSLIADFLLGKDEIDRGYYQKIYDWLDGRPIEQKPAECGCTNDESEYDKGYREGHRFGLKQTQEYMLSGGKTFSGLIPCWVNAPSELQPAHKYHGKNVVIMHENNGGFRCVCIDDKEPVTFHLPENTLFVEGWKKKPLEWSEEDEKMHQNLIHDLGVICEKDYPDNVNLKKGLNWLKFLRPLKEVYDGPWWSFTEKKDAAEEYVIQTARYPVKEPEYLADLEDAFISGVKWKGKMNWKPSKEQMQYLLAVINDPNNAGAESCHLILESLYNDLKKLM